MAKNQFLHKEKVQHYQKCNFWAEKKYRIFGSFKLFSGAKIDFLPFLKSQKMCHCSFEIALFSNFRVLCIVRGLWACDKIKQPVSDRFLPLSPFFLQIETNFLGNMPAKPNRAWPKGQAAIWFRSKPMLPGEHPKYPRPKMQ